MNKHYEIVYGPRGEIVGRRPIGQGPGARGRACGAMVEAARVHLEQGPPVLRPDRGRGVMRHAVQMGSPRDPHLPAGHLVAAVRTWATSCGTHVEPISVQTQLVTPNILDGCIQTAERRPLPRSGVLLGMIFFDNPGRFPFGGISIKFDYDPEVQFEAWQMDVALANVGQNTTAVDPNYQASWSIQDRQGVLYLPLLNTVATTDASLATGEWVPGTTTFAIADVLNVGFTVNTMSRADLEIYADGGYRGFDQ